MFKLRTGFLLSGIITGCILLSGLVSSIPDGKLHIFFCNVGQGDAAYVRFPDGRDMVVDGGPNDRIIGCLSEFMPFWDRHIDMVALTHPQRDHLQGLISVMERYDVDYMVRSDIEGTTEGFQELMAVVTKKGVPVKYMKTGERINVSESALAFLWPSDVLGATTNVNDYSLVFTLTYGSFDALFTGDADSRVEDKYAGQPISPIEVLKVPHHGSKTGMTKAFVEWVKPAAAVISVGKNTYGHPAAEILDLLASVGATVYRTDKDGVIEVVSDGKSWNVAVH